MDVQALATTPLFLTSLVLCALVAAYSISMIFFSMFRSISKAAATAGLRPYELEAVECAGIFHNQLEDLIDKVITLEELSAEMHGPFEDHTWPRLLDLCDNLEVARGELNSLLSTRDFTTAYELGRLLAGVSSVVPPIPRSPDALELRLVCSWQIQAHELLERMVAKIEDSLSYGVGGPATTPSPQFIKTLEELKEELIEAGESLHRSS
jgi:hypothetical protein